MCPSGDPILCGAHDYAEPAAGRSALRRVCTIITSHNSVVVGDFEHSDYRFAGSNHEFLRALPLVPDGIDKGRTEMETAKLTFDGRLVSLEPGALLSIVRPYAEHLSALSYRPEPLKSLITCARH